MTTQSGSGMGYVNILGQLGALGMNLASQRRTPEERLNRRIARGGEDPALAALRSQLAAQNARTAMAVAASQQGVNPALAQRNAQMALADSQARTNTEFARLGAQGAQQARGAATEAERARRTRLLAGGAQAVGSLFQGLAATQAGAQASKPDMQASKPGMAAAPMQQAVDNARAQRIAQFSAPENAAGLSAPAPSATQYTPTAMPAPTPGQMPMQGAQPAGVVPGLGVSGMRPAPRAQMMPTTTPDFQPMSALTSQAQPMGSAAFSPAGRMQMQGGAQAALVPGLGAGGLQARPTAEVPLSAPSMPAMESQSPEDWVAYYIQQGHTPQVAAYLAASHARLRNLATGQ